MKVIQISNFFPEFRGSFIDQLELLGDSIKENGGECVYIFPHKAKSINWSINLSKKHKVYFVSHINRKTQSKVVKELKAIFKLENPEIIHSHFDGYDVPLTKASAMGVKRVYHRHNEFDLSALPWYKKIYAQFYINQTAHYLKDKGYSIFISGDMLSSFVAAGYVRKEKSRLIFNGIATERLEKQNFEVDKFDRPVIFSLIGNWHRKGGDVLYDALKIINNEVTKVYLACIISGERLDLIKNQKNGLPSWLIPVSITDDIKKYYQMADIFVSASRKETFSYALGEAVFIGLPCISSDIDGVQWAKELQSVRFFENENKDSLAQEIEFLLNNKIDNDALLNDKDIIKNKYSEFEWCKNVLNFYDKILNTA